MLFIYFIFNGPPLVIFEIVVSENEYFMISHCIVHEKDFVLVTFSSYSF